MLTLRAQTTINDEYPSFSHGSADRIKEILENSGTEILGSWTSLDLRYSYNDGRYEEIPTNEYSIEIRDDGTFRAVLGSEITGSWELGEISFYSGGASHSYSLTSEAWPNGATLSLSGSSIRLQIRFDDRYEYYTFAMLSEEELAQFAELEKTGPTMIVGEWTSVLVQNSTADNNYTLSNATGYSVTFSEDGTFSGYLSRDISGTWEYAGISPNTDYNGSGMVCDYHLRFDGESNTPYTVSIANGKLDIFLRNEEAGAYDCHDLYKWSAEELKQFEAGRKSLVGTWNFKGAYTYDSSTDSQIDYDAGSCSLELSEDGSFSAVLGSSCSGTWAYAGMENNCPTVQLSFTDTTGYWPIPIVDGVLELWREISDQYIGFAFEK